MREEQKDHQVEKVGKELRVVDGLDRHGVLMMELFVVEGPDAGRSFALGPQSVIGRDPTAAVHLVDEEVSRRHAIITRRRGQGDRRGPRLVERHARRRGQIDAEVELGPGQRLRVGQTVMELRASERRGRPREPAGHEGAAAGAGRAARAFLKTGPGTVFDDRGPRVVERDVHKEPARSTARPTFKPGDRIRVGQTVLELRELGGSRIPRTSSRRRPRCRGSRTSR